jgi:D-cysteine desulfhydrase
MRIPKKFSLANIPTPIHTMNFEGNNFLIKRDDYTGTELSGNKVRKLDYLMYQAKKNKAEYIFTAGGDQSNHARATALYAARLGFKSRLFLWGSESASADGNLFLDKFSGAYITYLNKKEFYNVNSIMTDHCRQYTAEGKKVYIIPPGGSTTLGIWGYINFVYELKEQIDINRLKGVVVASGSGGTAAGLLAGLSLLGYKTKVYAVNVLDSYETTRKTILRLAEACSLDFQLECEINENQLEVLDGFSTEGYKSISDDKLKLLKSFARSTGIILDPAYTGKAFAAYYDRFLSKGRAGRVLFIHTGGLFGAFTKREQYLSV